MPNFSCSTFTTGARQLVVQEAFEIMLCLAGSYLSSFTPSTMVMSSFLAGAEMMTFFTVPRRCFGSLRCIRELPGGFDHDLRADTGPIDLRRVLDRENLDAFARRR